MPRPILEIYRAYNIFALLQTHQLRVAAVAKAICGNLNTPVIERPIIEACLLHDMGNILKTDLKNPLSPNDFKEKGLAFWEAVKEELHRKYGPNEHEATIAIAQEIGVSQETIACINAIGFSRATATSIECSLEHKISCYADMRVAPTGVLPLRERIEEAHKRYMSRKNFTDPELFERAVKAFEQMEINIFKSCRLPPEEINDASIAKAIEELRGWSI